jgi:pyochelin biosynthetic protein PchC
VTGSADVVYCLPHAGGGRHNYLALGSHLGERWDPLEYRGRYTRDDEPQYTSGTDAIDDLASIVTRSAAGRRIGLFGHSLGGTLAFELARALIAAGSVTVTAVVVSSAPPPADLVLVGAPLHALQDEPLLDHLVELCSNPRQRPLLAAVLPYLRADFQLHYNHRPASEPALSVPLHVAVGITEPFTDRMGGWRAWSSEGFELHRFPGGHFHWQADREALGALLCDVFGADSPARSVPQGSE